MARAGARATSPCPIAGGVTGNVTATAVFTTSSAVQTGAYGVSLGSPANGSVTGGPGGAIDCSDTTTDCSLTVVLGSTITVVETPDAATAGPPPTPPYFFGGWGGSCSGTSVACATYITANRTASATFVANTTNPLTVSVAGNGAVVGGGINCGAGSTCDAQEPPNSSVTLTATPQSGYAFTGWTDGCTGSQSTCTVQMDTARNVTATFEQLVPISLSVSGAGTVSGGGLSCGPGPQTCTGSVPPDSTLTLTGTPTSGGTVSWSGCSSTAGAICSIDVTTNALSVTASFLGGTTPPPTSTYSLTLSVTGDGYVVSGGNPAIHCTAAGGTGCIVNVQANTSLTLTAVPATGNSSDFHGPWTGSCSTFMTTTCTLTMTGPKSAGATFAGGNTTYLLTGQVTGSGTIAGAGMSCTTAGGTGCNVPQAAGATVTLTASAGTGASFTGWTGACSGTSATCSVTMSAAKSVGATFSTSGGGGGGGTTASLALTVTGAGAVSAAGGACASTNGKSKSCTQQYRSGQTVILTAKPAAGFVLAGWTGACSGKKATCDVTLTSSLAVGATFARLALAPGAKPKVTKIAHGYRVTLSFVAHVAGTAALGVTRSGKILHGAVVKVKPGRRKVSVIETKTGRYVFTLRLGTHSIRWRVTVR